MPSKTLPISSLSNGCGLTRGPDSNTTTCQVERQPRAVKLARVRRATARGSQHISARKAAGFSPELGVVVLLIDFFFEVIGVAISYCELVARQGCLGDFFRGDQ